MMPKCDHGVLFGQYCDYCDGGVQKLTKDDTDGEWLGSLFTPGGCGNCGSSTKSDPKLCFNCGWEIPNAVVTKSELQSHIISLLAAERQAIKAEIPEKRPLCNSRPLEWDEQYHAKWNATQEGFNQAIDQFHKIIKERDE